MHRYGLSEVEQLLRLPRSAIRRLVQAGFVAPTRGPRNALRFSFQDLIVLRTARGLIDAKLSPRRIARALRQLRDQLSDATPLSGLSICAEANRVVVKQGGQRWQVDSGQYLLALDVDIAAGVLRVMPRPPPDAEACFSLAMTLEANDAPAALAAYRRALAADPAHLGAALNLGRLLHEGGRLEDAERVYRAALASHADDALLRYNLGVLLEDMNRIEEAVLAYERALRDDAGLADCHYNLARAYESLGKPRQAIRHLAQYRRLVGEDRD